MKINMSDREAWVILQALNHLVETGDMTPEYRDEVVLLRSMWRDILNIND